MRKGIGFLVIVTFVLAASAAMALGANNVASTSQKGSLLIYPKIDISSNHETFVTLSNDNFVDVDVKCYWVRGSDQHTQDFMFRVTANQPVFFQASTGMGAPSDPAAITVPPFEGPTGFLACWAVDPAGANQISFNHLYGTATVIDYGHTAAFEYNSWNFATRGTVQTGFPVGSGGNITLDGTAYDSCPQYLAFNFPAVGAFNGLFVNDDLTLLPCKQDLRQDRTITKTKAKFDLWNENEVKYTGVFQCMNCWFEGLLDTLENNAGKFTLSELHSSMGRFRVTGVASSVCSGSQASPLLGVSAQLLNTSGSTQSGFFDAIAGTTPNTAGTDSTGFILWDPQMAVVPMR